MRELNVAARSQAILSRRALQELSMLQGRVRRVSGLRRTALRILLASRRVTTALAQREFWLDFFRLDQEYRAAVRRLGQFCAAHAQPLDEAPLRRVVGPER
jgi:hypothetical protein